MRLCATQNSFESIFSTLSHTRNFKIIVEVLICGIHPVPRAYPSSDLEKVNATTLVTYSLSRVAIDVELGLLSMFYHSFSFSF